MVPRVGALYVSAENVLNWIERRMNSQLQQGQVGVAVEGAVLALLGDIVLEDSGGLGVVAVEAIEDGVNVGRAGLALVEGDTHLDGDTENGRVGGKKRGKRGWRRRRGREAERGDRKRAAEWMDSRFGWPDLLLVGFFDCLAVRLPGRRSQSQLG